MSVESLLTIQSIPPDDLATELAWVCEIGPWKAYGFTPESLRGRWLSPRMEFFRAVDAQHATVGFVAFRALATNEVLAGRVGADELQSMLGEGGVERCAYVHALAVRPGNQRGGLGCRLLAAVEQRAREVGAVAVALSVSDFNPDAYRFYVREGFVALGLTPDCIQPGKGEWLLVRRMKGEFNIDDQDGQDR